MAERFRGTGVILRFIEFMDVGSTNGWRLDDVVPAAEIVDRIGAVWPLEPVDRELPRRCRDRWRYRDGAGEIGVIASVTQPFCGACTRARISAEGKLYTCLFAAAATTCASCSAPGVDDATWERIARIWARRTDRYSDLRTERPSARRRSRCRTSAASSSAGRGPPRPTRGGTPHWCQEAVSETCSSYAERAFSGPRKSCPFRCLAPKRSLGVCFVRGFHTSVRSARVS